LNLILMTEGRFMEAEVKATQIIKFTTRFLDKV